MADQQTPPTVREQVNAPWSNLSTLPSTNWKVVTGTVVLFATTLMVFWLMGHAAYHERDSHVENLLDSWLLFVGTAVLGVSMAQYVSKRMTYKPGGPDDQRAQLNNAASMADATGTFPVPASVTAAPVITAPPISVTTTPSAPVVAYMVPAAAPDAPGQQVPGSGD